MTQILRTIADARAALEPARASGPLALVPTMGALHDGHLSLVEIAKERAETVVVSIFVNPMQFAPGEDFERYPRTFDEDVAKLEAAGVDYVFAPAVDEMYPRGLKQTRVVGGPAAAILEGQHRLSHFDGVLTVVAKLFNITRPHLAIFGEKDAQQLHLIRRMSIDLDMGIEVIGPPSSASPTASPARAATSTSAPRSARPPSPSRAPSAPSPTTATSASTRCSPSARARSWTSRS